MTYRIEYSPETDGHLGASRLDSARLFLLRLIGSLPSNPPLKREIATDAAQSNRTTAGQEGSEMFS